MILSISERILVQNILPSEWTYEELLISEDVREKVKLTQEEVFTYEVKTTVENWHSFFTWNEQGSTAEFDINFTESEKNYIFTELKELSNNGKLRREHLAVYKKFNS